MEKFFQRRWKIFSTFGKKFPPLFLPAFSRAIGGARCLKGHRAGGEFVVPIGECMRYIQKTNNIYLGSSSRPGPGAAAAGAFTDAIDKIA
jgi:hypothetical protein